MLGEPPGTWSTQGMAENRARSFERGRPIMDDHWPISGQSMRAVKLFRAPFWMDITPGSRHRGGRSGRSNGLVIGATAEAPRKAVTGRIHMPTVAGAACTEHMHRGGRSNVDRPGPSSTQDMHASHACTARNGRQVGLIGPRNAVAHAGTQSSGAVAMKIGYCRAH